MYKKIKEIWNRILEKKGELQDWWFYLFFVSYEERRERLFRKLMKRMLKGKGIKLEELLEKSKENPDWHWWTEFEWSCEEEEKFKKWAIKKAHKTLGLTEEYAAKTVGMFLLQYGLTTMHDPKWKDYIEKEYTEEELETVKTFVKSTRGEKKRWRLKQQD